MMDVYSATTLASKAYQSRRANPSHRWSRGIIIDTHPRKSQYALQIPHRVTTLSPLDLSFGRPGGGHGRGGHLHPDGWCLVNSADFSARPRNGQRQRIQLFGPSSLLRGSRSNITSPQNATRSIFQAVFVFQRISELVGSHSERQSRNIGWVRHPDI